MTNVDEKWRHASRLLNKQQHMLSNKMVNSLKEDSKLKLREYLTPYLEQFLISKDLSEQWTKGRLDILKRQFDKIGYIPNDDAFEQDLSDTYIYAVQDFLDELGIY